jgi:branched-chain amino acid transport system permease protein
VSAFVPSSIMNEQQIPQFGWIVVGVGLMLLVIFRPQGILGNKKELTFGD